MSSSHVRRWLALAIVLPALIYIAALLFYPNRDWLILWPRTFDVPLPTVLIVSACVLSYAAGALWLGQRSRISWGAVMAFVIVGGLLFSLVLTLYVVPVIYTYLSRRKSADELGEDGQQRPLPQPEGRPTGDATRPEELEVRV